MSNESIFALVEIDVQQIVDEFTDRDEAFRAYRELLAREPGLAPNLAVIEYADYEDDAGRIVLGGPPDAHEERWAA